MIVEGHGILVASPTSTRTSASRTWIDGCSTASTVRLERLENETRVNWDAFRIRQGEGG